jgi:hypothetical protein
MKIIFQRLSHCRGQTTFNFAHFFRTIKLRVNGALEDQIRAQRQVNLKDTIIMSKKKVIFNGKLVHN